MPKINWLLLSLVGIVWIFNLPYFDPQIVPVHDTFYQFCIFHLFYSEWFFNHDVAAWLPYCAYGVPALFYQLHVFTVMDYLVMAVGKLLAVENVMLLFKIGVVLSIHVFMYGMYKLSSLLFKSRMTVFLVTLFAVGSIVWFSNIHINFRFYSGFPIVAYWIMRFYQEQDGRFLGFAGLWGLLFWFIGCNPYHSVIWTLMVILMMGTLHIQQAMSFKKYLLAFQGRYLHLLFAGLLLGFFALCFTVSLRELLFDTPGRDMYNATVTNMDDYLQYGGQLTWELVIKSIFSALPVFIQEVGMKMDLAVYSGVLIPVFAIYAWIKVHDKKLYIFSILALFFLMMSFGGYFARLLAYIPGVMLYRHLPFLLEIVKVLLIICAGFGLDHFWKISNSKRIKTLLLVLAVAFICFEHDVESFTNFWLHWGLVLVGFVNWSGHMAKTLYFLYVAMTLLAIVVCLILLATALIKSIWRPLNTNAIQYWRVGLGLFVLLDLFLFQNQAFLLLPNDADMLTSAKVFAVRPIRYQEKRVMDPLAKMQEDEARFFTPSKSNVSYASNYNFIQLDLCEIPYRQDLETRRVYNFRLLKSFETIWKGCENPKLLILDRVNGIQENSKITSQAVKVDKFSTNDLIVSIESPQSGYLLYADAMHSYWRAMVNQKMTPIKPANTAFKSVAIPAGKSIVHFFIDPKIVAVSTILAIIGLVSAVYFLVLLGSEIVRTKEQ